MRGAPHALVGWLAAGLITAPNAGAETSPYAIGLGQSVLANSNLLRLDSGRSAPAGLSRSDVSSITSLFATLDQGIGRQRLFGSATLRAERLAQNTAYDHNGFAIRGGIDWATVERLSGSFSLASSRGQARLSDTDSATLQARNLESTQQIDAVARLGLVGRFGVELGYAGRRVSYSAASFAAREFRQQAISFGMRYRPTGASSFAAGMRFTRGVFPNFQTQPDGSALADRFERRDLDLSAHVEPSGASSFDLRLSLGRSDHDRATQRDFSGLTGAAAWAWRPTGKLRLTTTLGRDSGQESSFNEAGQAASGVDYSRLTSSLTLRTDYDFSAKVGFNGQFAIARRSLVNKTPTGAAVRDGDTTVTLALGASWLPTRTVRLGCDLGAEDRRAGGGPAPTLSSNYRGNSFGCHGQITLQ